jgi:hypothetical protein
MPLAKARLAEHRERAQWPPVTLEWNPDPEWNPVMAGR